MENEKYKGLFVMAGLLAFLAFSIPTRAAADERTPGIERIEKAIQVLREMVDLPEEGLPSRLLEKCHGIAVIPGVIKAAYGFGGQYGRGLIVIRNEDGTWSNPTFISLIGGSLGWQIGVQKADIVLVFKTGKSIENMDAGKVTMGADMSVAAGPVGRNAEASTDLDMEAEIYSYSRSKGLFAGVSIKGASIQIDKDANQAFYDKRDISARDILYGSDIQAPPVVKDLKAALKKRTAPRI
ncbi:MAG: lipid-binding SYLF domain-containing protein [Candidatus Aminicenantes bacterium]|nr:lipid-binding SYLF domain-containing protein [Candidatus Aminicenantes bacterium]